METAVSKAFHVFVEVELNQPAVQIEFDTDEVTGKDIKVAAGVPLDDDLALRQGDKLDLVTNDQPVKIKNGQHFVVFPPGTIS